MSGTLRDQLSEALRSALDATHDPAVAAVDWLCQDIDPTRPTAEALLTDPRTPLETLQAAKSAFKTMRMVGETASDRRLAARMYLASIAAALVRHNARISRQSDRALVRHLQQLHDEEEMPEKIRGLAGLALCMLRK